MSTLVWNDKTELILADVDETIADVYTAATPAMLDKLSILLKRNIKLFLVTGAGLESVLERIVNRLDSNLKKNIIIAHCSGAEICGIDNSGQLLDPYYSIYDQKMNSDQKLIWRNIIDQIISEFHLETTPTMQVIKFKSLIGDNPLVVMKADRGPQITLEFVNSYDLSSSQLAQIEKELDIKLSQIDGKFDLRTAIYNRAEELLFAAKLPVHPHLAGVFALDFILEGVSKTSALTQFLSNKELLAKYKLPDDILQQPNLIEIWGDKFTINGGSDRKMCMAVHPKVRAIDFRPEPISDIGNEYNIQLWDGKESLHNGLLEYLSQTI